MVRVAATICALRIGLTLLLASCADVALSQIAQFEGRRLFLDPKKGNCIACHQVPGDPTITSSSRIGRPLTEIRKQYPDVAKLRAIIWDLGSTAPDTIMPPYGRHRILTEAEIDAVVRYIEDL